MFKSFAYVGLFATLAALNGVAFAQEANDPTTTTVNNHISDAERDRLMQEAMEQARRDLEKSKAEREARQTLETEQQTQASREAAAAKAAAEKDAARKRAEAAAAKKAEEERMAKELAEAEKKSSEKSRETKVEEVTNLDSKPASTPTAKSESQSAKTSTASASSSSNKTSSNSRKSEPESSSDEGSKVVVETVATRDPSTPITVKTAMPQGDAARQAEQQAARQSSSGSARSSGSSSSSNEFTGQVVGMMRSTSDKPRILVRTDNHRMVQVVLDTSEVPAPGSVVSFSGKTIGGDGPNLVVSASRVSIKTGQALEPVPVAPVPPEVAMHPMDPYFPPPMMHDPMMAPHPMMPPPMPMPMAPMMPGPMMAGPPPF